MKRLLLFVFVSAVSILILCSIILALLFNPISRTTMENLWRYVFHKEAVTVKEYLIKAQNFDGIEGKIESAKIKIGFSDGFAKNMWENELFLLEKTRDFWNQITERAKNTKKLTIPDSATKYLDEQIKNIEEQRINIHQSANNIAVKTLEKNKNSAKVQVNYEISAKNFNGEQKLNQQGVYTLKLINGSWKIVDFTDKDGAWSETRNLEKEKEELISSLENGLAAFDDVISYIEAWSDNKNIKGAQIVTSYLWKDDFESGNNWSGQRSEIVMLSPSNAAARIKGSAGSAGYLFMDIAIPADASYISFEMQNEKTSLDNFLTVTLGDSIISYENLSKIDGKMREISDLFIGNKAGKTETLLFSVNQVGKDSPSVLIDNIKFYKKTVALPK